MLDTKVLRENPGLIRANLEKRGDAARIPVLENAVRWDREWRDSVQELDGLRHQRNVVTDEIRALKQSGQDAAAKIREAAELPVKIKALEAHAEELQRNLRGAMLRLPNLLHGSVPPGATEADNVEVRRWGEPRVPKFELKAHGELAEALGVADFERGRKAAGAGFVYLLGDLARLDMAILRFGVDFLGRRGFTPVFPPHALRRSAYEGMVDLSAFEEMMYKVEGEDLYLIATSEHPIGAMFMDEIVDADRLPMRFAGMSTNFRKEIGAHGVDTKGLFRMHQFNKVEQFVFCRPEDSWRLHEELEKNAEDFYRALGIPFRVVTLCAGDTGKVAAKTYDLEAWFPRQKMYREVGSNSNCTDYQARRLNLRAGKIGGEKFLVHTLNNTLVATSRCMVAILENFQRADGTVTVPRVLRPYMGGVERIGGTAKKARGKKAGPKKARQRVRRKVKPRRKPRPRARQTRSPPKKRGRSRRRR